MLAYDRSALICDLAETYRIYDYKALPVLTLAALASGLRPDSRIKLKLSGITEVSSEVLLIQIFDILQLMRYQWFATKNDAPPTMLADKLFDKAPEVPDEKRDKVLDEILAAAKRDMEVHNDG
jgi:hypothetical protein